MVNFIARNKVSSSQVYSRVQLKHMRNDRRRVSIDKDA